MQITASMVKELRERCARQKASSAHRLRKRDSAGSTCLARLEAHVFWGQGRAYPSR